MLRILLEVVIRKKGVYTVLVKPGHGPLQCSYCGVKQCSDYTRGPRKYSQHHFTTHHKPERLMTSRIGRCYHVVLKLLPNYCNGSAKNEKY